MHGEVIKSAPCYLIGQLAKNSAVQNAVSGAYLMEKAILVIKSAAREVGGRYVLVECRDDPHLRKLYTDNGFEEFDTIPDEAVPMSMFSIPPKQGGKSYRLPDKQQFVLLLIWQAIIMIFMGAFSIFSYLSIDIIS